GVATGVISTALATLATISVPESRRGEGISYFSLRFVLGSAVRPFLGLLLLEVMSYSTMLILVLAAVLIVALMIPLVKINNISRAYKPEPGRLNMIDRTALTIGFSVLFTGLAYASILSFLNLYPIEFNLITAASFFFRVYSAVVMLTRPVTGKILDQKGANIVLYPTFIFMAIGFYILGNSTTSFVMLLAGALIGLGFGNFQSIAQTLSVNLADKENVGLATSTYFIMLEVGLGFGPFFLGFLVPSLGYGGLYQFLVLSIMAAMVIFYFVYGRHESRGRSAEKMEENIV